MRIDQYVNPISSKDMHKHINLILAMAGTEVKQLESLLKKSTEEQQKGVTAAVQAAFSRKDVSALEKMVQYGFFYSFIFLLVFINQQFVGAHGVLLETIADKLKDLDKEQIIAFTPKLLELMASKTLANEQNEYKIRKELAAAYSYMEEPQMAARALSSMHLEQVKEKIGIPAVVEAYVKITEYCLDAENNADAYSYITKAAQYIDSITDTFTLLKYKYCYAQVHDANLKFGQAASLYYELSQKGTVGVPEEEIRAFLNRAVTCTLLAPPGTQRSRLLTLLYKDERTRTVAHFNLLEKMYLDRLIKMSEVTKFEEDLKPHQRGMTIENYTVLQKAVLEHDVLALSKIYTNISIDQLSKLLEIPTDRAEMLVASMISEGKIKAHINQADQFVYFEAEKEMIQRFNELIGNLCEGVNQLIQETAQKYPHLGSILKAQPLTISFIYILFPICKTLLHTPNKLITVNQQPDQAYTAYISEAQ
eukprot:TRINITY_DN1784_c0_g2_i3.p2 TRINITY_DN1784_c0_g2~~TRINITY_DN1784_c0_g2_i3.p2  ORF type:complete len:478 (-),score=47.46 TRINITY_DN1784_c0_g2_i3:14167-15600(-)